MGHQMQNKFTSLWSAAAIVWASVSVSHADPLVIGVEDNRYLPYYSYEDGEYAGFGRDILDAFFSEAQIDYEFRALPVARLFNDFVNGHVDFKFPDNEIWFPDEKKGLAIRYSDPVVAYIDGVSVTPGKIDTPVEKVNIIGTVRGFAARGWQDKIDSGEVILSENSSTVKLVQQVLGGRIHGAYANINVIQHIVETQLGSSVELIFDASLPHTRSDYRLASHQHPKIIEQFNQWLIDNSEIVQALKQKHKIALH